MPALLAGHDLWASYDGVRALQGVTVEVPSGAAVAVVGANGAGKSTLLRVLSGLHPPERGRVLLGGTDVTGLPAHRIARLGLTLVPESRGTFPALTVAENLRLATRRPPERVREVFPALAGRLAQVAGTLSGGEQQMLALARCLLTEARVVLLDEPSLALAPRLVEEIFAAVAALKRAGRTVVLVEQYVGRALELADLVYVLRRGEVAFAGEPREAAARDALERAYLGGRR
ncbi:MAG TPA: ABC transporter ATP-binding protein [Actinomycetota bacterium]|nr:ABC transporter ATP-binding protein [Actinomycetota bacterium]